MGDESDSSTLEPARKTSQGPSKNRVDLEPKRPKKPYPTYGKIHALPTPCQFRFLPTALAADASPTPVRGMECEWRMDEIAAGMKLKARADQGIK